MHRPSADLTDPSRNLEESMGPASPSSPDPTLDLDAATHLDNDDGRIHTPPPRIAARFYRPSAARRKDSAASSRRNSISSAHSRSSRGGDSHSIGPQSKHVAQHLRRASILEDRKARLADRAAHAEKVRLRAALAKAATRNTTASEERALAAQQARERNLAEIVAACAEEVKRAKAVAESTKEKREQEIQKLRVQMEERMAEADRRREELRKMNAARRGRSQSTVTRKPMEVMPQVKEQESDPEPDQESVHPEISQEVAIARIETWWKAGLRKKAIQAFSELGLSVDRVRETSFEKVVDLLAQEKVLTATARVLRICGLNEGDTGSVSEMAAVRTFLSAFLILGHPTQVLSSKDDKGEQEQVGTVLGAPAARNDLADPQLQDLVAKARDLLICFENILPRLSSFNNYTPPPALLETLPEIYATFYNAFIAWKARDSTALIDVMILQFVELDAIWETVKDSPEDSVTESYRKSIKDNQLMLMVRIKRLAGSEEGKKMVFKAVHQARKARAAKKPIGDTKPRITEQAVEDAEDTMIEDAPTEQSGRTPVQLQTPPATPNAKAQPHHAKQQHQHQHHGFQGIIPDNRILMHELAINKEYAIDAQEYKEQASYFLKQPFQEARANIDNENREAQFRFLILMSQHIKTKLQRLVKPGQSMFNLIGEILDIEVAERQFIAGSFSYEKFFAAMGSLLPKLCAPIRDDEVKKLINEQLSQGHVVDRLEALIGFIDVMLSDYANYLLRLSAPRLLSQASNYETKHFGLALENGVHTLQEAEAAWRRARAKVHAEVNKRDPEGINHPRSRPTAERIYSQMLVDTFTQVHYTPESALPEMLRLDYKRVNKLGQQTLTIITAGAILLQCKNLLKRDVRVPWKTEATRILTVMEHEHKKQDDMVDGVMAALVGAKTMPAATKVHLRALATKMLNASVEARNKRTEPTEPVLRLLLSRIRSHMLARLAVASASEKVKATSTAGEKLASLGLPEFVERIREMVDEISRVGAVDRESHSMWWENVANKVEAEAVEGSMQL